MVEPAYASYVRTRLSAIPECGWQWDVLNPFDESWGQVKVALENTEAEREGKRCLRYAWSEGYSSIDSAGDSSNERASSVAKSTRLITWLLFLFYPLPALPGTYPAGQGAPRLHVQGDRNLD